MFVTREELETITGLRQFAAQKRWLIARGWKFELNAGGRPIVLRAEMERRMLSQQRGRKMELGKVA